MINLRHQINLFFISLLFCLALFFAHIGYVWFLPTSHYFRYDKTFFNRVDGDDIYMTSVYGVFEEISIEWEDTLYCRGQGKGIYRHRSTQVFSTSSLKPFPEGTERPWTFNGNVLKNGECYIKSVVTATVGYGFKKRQIVYSDKFNIGVGK